MQTVLENYVSNFSYFAKLSNVPGFSRACSVLRLSPREDEVFFDVVATVDPLTRDAQKLAPLLIVRAAVN